MKLIMGYVGEEGPDHIVMNVSTLRVGLVRAAGCGHGLPSQQALQD